MLCKCYVNDVMRFSSLSSLQQIEFKFLALFSSERFPMFFQSVAADNKEENH